jgi:hypothetical protein
MTASSPIDSTVDAGCLGPVGRPASCTWRGLCVDPVAPSQGPQALLTMLYRSTDRRCRRGAAMKNLAHSASRHAGEKSEPSKPGIKPLVRSLRHPINLEVNPLDSAEHRAIPKSAINKKGAPIGAPLVLLVLARFTHPCGGASSSQFRKERCQKWQAKQAPGHSQRAS